MSTVSIFAGMDAQADTHHAATIDALAWTTPAAREAGPGVRLLNLVK